MGGLHVIGTERHEARRIDNQLRGRSGRQGDKGSSAASSSPRRRPDEDVRGRDDDEGPRAPGHEGGRRDRAPDALQERRARPAQGRGTQLPDPQEHARVRRGDGAPASDFYGLRQRVLEGRDVKGLIFRVRRDAVDDACEEYLDPDYPASASPSTPSRSSSARSRSERLQGLERDEMEKAIREDAKAMRAHDRCHARRVHADGGLRDQRRLRLGGPDQLGQVSASASSSTSRSSARAAPVERNRVRDMLAAAAEEKIETADLTGIDEFVRKHYGPASSSSGSRTSSVIDVTEDEIEGRAAGRASRRRGADPQERREDLYTQREIEYPVEFAMDMTKMLMRQAPAGREYLVKWANQRFALGWTVEHHAHQPAAEDPADPLLEARAKVRQEGKLEEAIARGSGLHDRRRAGRAPQERFSVGITEYMRFLEGEEREPTPSARASRTSCAPSCCSSSGRSCSRPSTSRGRTTCTRWTSSATPSASARSASRTPASRTSARARACSRHDARERPRPGDGLRLQGQAHAAAAVSLITPTGARPATRRRRMSLRAS
jgi:hypothetical protein